MPPLIRVRPPGEKSPTTSRSRRGDPVGKGKEEGSRLRFRRTAPLSEWYTDGTRRMESKACKPLLSLVKYVRSRGAGCSLTVHHEFKRRKPRKRDKPAHSGLFCCSGYDEIRRNPVKTDARPYKEPYNFIIARTKDAPQIPEYGFSTGGEASRAAEIEYTPQGRSKTPFGTLSLCFYHIERLGPRS